MPSLLRVVSTGNSKRDSKKNSERKMSSSSFASEAATPAAPATEKHDEASAASGVDVRAGKPSPENAVQANTQGQEETEKSLDGVETKTGAGSDEAAGAILAEATKADITPQESKSKKADAGVASGEPVRVPEEDNGLDSNAERHPGDRMPKQPSSVVQDNSVKVHATHTSPDISHLVAPVPVRLSNNSLIPTSALRACVRCAFA